MTSKRPYTGHQAALATRHGKWELIAPVMNEKLSLTVVNVDVDTDALGTFSGDVPRRGTPIETAVAKARLGMESSGLTLGIANEGTIGPHPAIPFVIADTELVVLVDEERGIVVSECETEIGVPGFRAEIHPSECVTLDLAAAGFPSHGLIVMSISDPSHIIKGLHDRNELEEAAWKCLRASGESKVMVQSDFRAHHHPTRRTVIERAARRLADRLTALCPRCTTPGWGIVRHEGGAPCSECGTCTTQLRFTVFACAKCLYEEPVEVAPRIGADPMYCLRCNP